jgi:hypothetical protein
MGMIRGLWAVLGLAAIVLVAWSVPVAFADDVADAPLRVYGLALDETRLGSGFCEKREFGEPVRLGCGASQQAIPKIADIDVQTTPASHVRLTLTPDSTGRERAVRIWYAPREEGGQSFMIATTTFHELGFEHARNGVLESFGPPTLEFSHAQMEARGIEVADLTVDTLIYVDRALPDTERGRLARRLRTQFNPTGAELFSLTNTRLRTLSRLLGRDFRGAIVQVSESGWSNDSTVTTILLDLRRAQSVFRLDG